MPSDRDFVPENYPPAYNPGQIQPYDPFTHDPHAPYGQRHTPQHAPSYPRTYQPVTVAAIPGLKSPALAVVFSFFLPGVGSIYAGKAAKGTWTLVAYLFAWLSCLLLIGFILAPAVWIFGMVAGANDVTKHNDQLIGRATPPSIPYMP